MKRSLRQLAFFCFIPIVTFAALGSMWPFAFGTGPTYVHSVSDSNDAHYRASVVETNGELMVVLERSAWKMSIGRVVVFRTAPPSRLSVQWRGSGDLSVTCHVCNYGRTGIPEIGKWRTVRLHYFFDPNG